VGNLPTPITRRQFVRLALVSATSTLVGAACQSPTSPIPPSPTPEPITIPSPTTETIAIPSPTPQAVATATSIFPSLSQNTPALLGNRNDPHYNVRYVNPFSPVDHEAWQLEVKGLVEAPGRFDLADLLAWPQVEQVSRMKCVECWSFKAKWGGFRYETLAEHVKPRPEATHVRFDCADRYWEIASVKDLADPRVLFVLKMNDERLLDEYGAPLRTMFPARYGYKSAKAVISITFGDQSDKGFWSTAGPYTVDGKIEPGSDSPQELPGEIKQIDGGEITAY